MPQISFTVTSSIFPVPDTAQIEAIKPELTDFLHECMEKVLNAQFEKDSLALMEFEAADHTFASISNSEEEEEEGERNHARAVYNSHGWGPGAILESAVDKEISDSLELEGGFSVYEISVQIDASENTIKDIHFG